MAEDPIQARYDDLVELAHRFEGAAETIRVLDRTVRSSYRPCQQGAWLGRGAEAFSAEMDRDVLPAIIRLADAMATACTTIQEMLHVLQKAEKLAANLFNAGVRFDLTDLVRSATSTHAHSGVHDWTTADLIKWKSPIGGDPNYIHEFKQQWVQGYREVIKAAAATFDLPELLVGGVAYTEVGGDPSWIDDVAYDVRSFDHIADPPLEPLTITKPPQETSFGNVSMQIRRAARTVGIDPQTMTRQQETLIIAALEDPRINIFLAAKHLAELRDIDFKGKTATTMTLDEIKVTATRFNRGPEMSIGKIRENLSYGESIAKRSPQIKRMLAD